MLLRGARPVSAAAEYPRECRSESTTAEEWGVAEASRAAGFPPLTGSERTVCVPFAESGSLLFHRKSQGSTRVVPRCNLRPCRERGFFVLSPLLRRGERGEVVKALIIVMKTGADEEEIQGVIKRLEEIGFGIHLSRGAQRTVIGAIGGEAEKAALASAGIEAVSGVERVVPIMKPYKLVSRDFRKESSTVKVGDVSIGGDEIIVIAGPCAVESREQLFTTASAVAQSGARLLRGGAFKPRTSPYTFQGLEEDGLKLLAEARERYGLPVVTEVVAPEQVPLVAKYADMLQVGARNMQNFYLLRAVGRAKKPVLLKRGMAATIQEWLMAAEYILSEGNYDVVLCERGLRTFETETRNTLDLNAVPVIKDLSHLPVIVDPSHGTGKWQLVTPMARAAVAAGADGVAVEVHPNPDLALSDGPQSLTPERFGAMMEQLAAIAQVLGRRCRRPREVAGARQEWG